VHEIENAEFYHSTKIEIIAEIGDALGRKLGAIRSRRPRNRA